MTQAIYVFRADGRSKIGISNNPVRRIRDLESRDPGISFAFAASTNGESARRLESRAHEILRLYRVRGEWFSVDVETAIRAVFEAAKDLGFELRVRGGCDHEDAVDTAETIGARVEASMIAALDDARRNEKDMPTRPEIIRRLLAEILKDKGYLRQ